MESQLSFDVKIGGVVYALVREPTFVHSAVLHRHLGTDTTTREPEVAIRRLLNAIEESVWFKDGVYVGRNELGIGVANLD